MPLLLKAYADDSGINQPPVSVLAGWVADIEKWILFSEEWNRILHMRPRVEYFKYIEAMHLRGQFEGLSEKSRDEKLCLLAALIAEFDLLGIAVVAPHAVFHKYFGNSKGGALRAPYPTLFVRFIARLQRHLIEIGGDLPKVEFCFDRQLDHEDKAVAGWNEFRTNAPPEMIPLFGAPPSFLDDKSVAPLQAADLHAGWARQMYSSIIEGRAAPEPKWGVRTDRVKVLTWIMTDEVAREMSHRLTSLGNNTGPS